MRRVLVVGQSGSGKSTVARRLASRLGVPHLELDALFHGPGWVQSPSFADDVDRLTAHGDWVVDGNYSAVRDLLWSRADTVVWLDLSRTTTLRRAVWRTVHRVVRRAELWNGNRERLRTVLRATHPIRWTWSTAAAHRAAYEERMADPRWSGLRIVRLTRARDVGRWLTQQDA